jgi:uncharacterized protein YwqG
MFALGALAFLAAFAVVWFFSVLGFRWLVGVALDAASRKGMFRYSHVRPKEAEGSEGAKVWRRMKSMAKPALLLVEATAPGFSKMGGRPDLPAGVEWPRTETPRAFVCQIDLVETSSPDKPDWLPETGRLYVFKDSEGFGRREDTMVLFSDQEPAFEAMPPSELDRKHRFSERRVAFDPIRSFPSLDWLNADVQSLDLSDVDLDFLADAPTAKLDKGPLHQVGGYPAEIQDGQMQVECEFLARGLTLDYREPVPEAIARASKQWRLLLQIDSDPVLGMNWGDGGRLYVFIKEKHARAGDFAKTVSLWQTY